MVLVKRGHSGRRVKKLQDQLRHVGWKVKGDGQFDWRTEAAVQCFQHDEELDKDGVVGPKTQGVLDKAFQKEKVKQVDPILWVWEDVPYYSQRDNVYKPSGTCNVTALAMVLAFQGEKPKEGIQLEDELFERLQEKDAQDYYKRTFSWAVRKGYNPRNVHGMLVWLAKKRGYTAEFSMKTSWEEMDEFGKSTGPMITSGQFTGFGHIVALIGRTACGDLIIHDSWGDWEKGYRGQRDGSFRVYTFENMRSILRPRENEKAKWVHRISRRR